MQWSGHSYHNTASKTPLSCGQFSLPYQTHMQLIHNSLCYRCCHWQRMATIANYRMLFSSLSEHITRGRRGRETRQKLHHKCTEEQSAKEKLFSMCAELCCLVLEWMEQNKYFLVGDRDESFSWMLSECSKVVLSFSASVGGEHGHTAMVQAAYMDLSFH